MNLSITNGKHKNFKRFLSILIIFMILLEGFAPTTAYAAIKGHDSYYVQGRLREDGVYTAEVKHDDTSFFAGAEQSAKLNFGKLFQNKNYNEAVKAGDGDVENDWGSYLYFSFPSHDSTAFWDNDYNNPQGDMERAYDIAELVNQLNGLINAVDAVDGEMNINSALNAKKATEELTKSGTTNLVNPNTVSGQDAIEITITNIGHIWYGYYSNDTSRNGIDFEQQVDKNGNFIASDINLFAYFSTTDCGDIDDAAIAAKKGEAKQFIWGKLKGYMAPDGNLLKKRGSLTTLTEGATYEDQDVEGIPFLSNLSNTHLSSMNTSGSSKLSDKSGDNTWITIFDIATVGNYYYTVEASTTAESGGSSWFEELIVDILQAFALGIKNLLGLSDITELVYGSNGNLSGGVMSNTWWSIMLKYHLIFQIIAWLLIGLAVAKSLLELNFSTISPSLRMNIMDTLQKIFIVGFLLALAVPIMKLMIDVNQSIVNIFKTEAPASDAEMFAIGDTIASVVAYLAYIGIVLMINCTYIMRGVMIAIFGAAAPLFIVSMLFSKGKGMFDNWFKEMAANIFLQSIHAFAFAFLISVIKSSATLPKMVVFYSLMPITEQFRGFIFGNSGGFATSQGNKMGQYLQSRINNAQQNGTNLVSSAGSSVAKNFTASGKAAKAAEAMAGGGGATGGTKAGAGAGAGGKGQGTAGAGGNASSTAKSMSAQTSAMGDQGLKSRILAGAGHALSAGGQAQSALMGAMEAMTAMQMGDTVSAAQGMNAASNTMASLGSSAIDYGVSGASAVVNAAKQGIYSKAQSSTSVAGNGKSVQSNANKLSEAKGIKGKLGAISDLSKSGASKRDIAKACLASSVSNGAGYSENSGEKRVAGQNFSVGGQSYTNFKAKQVNGEISAESLMGKQGAADFAKNMQNLGTKTENGTYRYDAGHGMMEYNPNTGNVSGASNYMSKSPDGRTYTNNQSNFNNTMNSAFTQTAKENSDYNKGLSTNKKKKSATSPVRNTNVSINGQTKKL